MTVQPVYYCQPILSQSQPVKYGCSLTGPSPQSVSWLYLEQLLDKVLDLVLGARREVRMVLSTPVAITLLGPIPQYRRCRVDP